ncbi:MAG: hypothetical protein QME60_01755 [Verrucomicrobiota bacterium]|nr:hypothetical protein [Verrucomicrobiota bacterium]
MSLLQNNREVRKKVRVVGVLAVLLIVGVGCETGTDVNSATQAEIQITPNYTSLGKGQAAEFTATGWHEYTWSLAYADWGTLTHKTGKTTVYTSVITTNDIQILTCAATVAGTNAFSTVAAQALIEHH